MNDFCSICYCSGIGDEPSVILGCTHVFHVNCLKDIIEKRWSGPRIWFKYLDCPECKARIEPTGCKPIDELLKKEKEFEAIVKKKIEERAKFEELHKHKDFKKLQPGHPYYKNLQKFAEHALSYY